MDGANPNPMRWEKPWIEHRQAEREGCVWTQTSTPEIIWFERTSEHHNIAYAPIGHGNNCKSKNLRKGKKVLRWLLLFSSSPKPPASQVIAALLPSPQRFQASNNWQNCNHEKKHLHLSVNSCPDRSCFVVYVSRFSHHPLYFVSSLQLG